MIRVYSIPNCTRIYSLKRGLAKADVYSLSFNEDSTLLGLTSSRGTLHIFALGGTSATGTSPKPDTALKPKYESREPRFEAG